MTNKKNENESSEQRNSADSASKLAKKEVEVDEIGSSFFKKSSLPRQGTMSKFFSFSPTKKSKVDKDFQRVSPFNTNIMKEELEELDINIVNLQRRESVGKLLKQRTFMLSQGTLQKAEENGINSQSLSLSGANSQINIKAQQIKGQISEYSGDEESSYLSSSGSELDRFGEVEFIKLEDIIPLLQKAPQERTQPDLLKLKDYLKNHLQGFQKKQDINEETMNQLVKAMRYQFQPQGVNLVNYGEKGTTFYIILNGVVNVRVPVDTTISMKIEDFDLYVQENEKFIIKQDHTYLLYKQEQKNPGKILFNQHYSVIDFKIKLLEAVTQVSSGDSFGELALMYDKPRQATIEALSDMHLVTLEKEDFQKVIGEANEKKINEELKFLKTFPILSHLTRITLHKLKLQCKIIKLKRGQVVYEEDKPWQYIYLIKSGEFEQSKTVKSIIQNDQGMFKQISNQQLKLKKDPLTQYTTNKNYNCSSQNNGKLNPNEKFKIAILSENEQCCLEEYGMMSKTNITTLLCTSHEGILYCVPKDFFKKIKSEEAMKNLKQLSNFKIDFLNKRMAQIVKTIKYKLTGKGDDYNENEQQIQQP